MKTWLDTSQLPEQLVHTVRLLPRSYIKKKILFFKDISSSHLTKTTRSVYPYWIIASFFLEH